MKIPRPAVIANSIRLKRQQHTGTFLIVEGKDDRLFMEKFIDRQACKIEVAQGKSNVLETVQILENSGFAGVLGLVDADNDRIESIQYGTANLVRYEHHDLETMLIASSALRRVFGELGSAEKLEQFDGRMLPTLLGLAFPMACLRLHSMRSSLGLDFDKLNYSRWIDRASWTSDVKRMIELVRDRSHGAQPSVSELEVEIQRVSNEQHPELEICNGTDLIEILSIGLRGRLGSKSSGEVRPDDLRQSLRLAFQDHEFATSELCAYIQDWEVQSGGFRVIAVT